MKLIQSKNIASGKVELTIQVNVKDYNLLDEQTPAQEQEVQGLIGEELIALIGEAMATEPPENSCTD